MITRFLTCLAALGLFAGTAAADPEVHTHSHVDGRSPHGVGVGLVLGEPTGLTLSHRQGPRSAIQGYATWSVVHDHARFSMDWIPSLAVVDGHGVQVPIYLGIGGLVAFNDDYGWAGARIPVGATLLPDNVPLEPFIEVAPVVFIAPDVDVGLEGVLGLRYYL